MLVLQGGGDLSRLRGVQMATQLLIYFPSYFTEYLAFHVDFPTGLWITSTLDYQDYISVINTAW